jgi:hypothetical protein
MADGIQTKLNARTLKRDENDALTKSTLRDLRATIQALMTRLGLVEAAIADRFGVSITEQGWMLYMEPSFAKPLLID